MRRSRALILAVVLSSVAACGSTVRLGATESTSAAGLRSGLGLPVTNGAPSPSQTSGAEGSASAAQAGPSEETGSSASSGASVPPSSGAAGPTAIGTKAAVEVGFAYLKNVQAFAALFGASADPGDQLGYIKAAVAWVNAHGGLQGHPITPLYYGIDATSTQPYATTAQAGCDYMTQDNHAIAVVVAGIDAPDQLPSCLSARHVFYTVSDHAMEDATSYRAMPYMLTPAKISLDRMVRAMLSQAADREMLPSGSKLGVLVGDYPAANRTLADVIKPAMAARKVDVVSAEIEPPASTAEVGNSISQIQSAVLRMKTQGVQTVTFMCPNCMTQFMQQANSQKFYPRYVFSSLDSPSSLTGSGTAQQLTGSLGISWEPDRDIDTYSEPKEFTGNPTRAECTGIEKSADTINTGLRVYASQAFCDAVLLIQAAAHASGSTAVTGTTLLAGAERLGTSHPSALTFSTSLSVAHHDGAAGYRTMTYLASCSCIDYSSSTVYAF